MYCCEFRDTTTISNFCVYIHVLALQLRKSWLSVVMSSWQVKSCVHRQLPPTRPWLLWKFITDRPEFLLQTHYWRNTFSVVWEHIRSCFLLLLFPERYRKFRSREITKSYFWRNFQWWSHSEMSFWWHKGMWRRVCARKPTLTDIIELFVNEVTYFKE